VPPELTALVTNSAPATRNTAGAASRHGAFVRQSRRRSLGGIGPGFSLVLCVVEMLGEGGVLATTLRRLR
jgi:hypothetical protein